MADTDHLWIDHDTQHDLCAALAGIPTLAEDLAVTLAREDRLARPSTSRRSKHGSTPDGINVSALSDQAELHAVMTSWVRLVLDARPHLDVPTDSLLTVATWLRAHIHDLAACEGSEEAPDEIITLIARVRHHIDHPVDNTGINADDPRIAIARHQADTVHITYSSIESVCKKMGVDPIIDARRMRHVITTHHIAPEGRDGKTKFWRLSDVLDADTDIRAQSA